MDQPRLSLVSILSFNSFSCNQNSATWFHLKIRLSLDLFLRFLFEKNFKLVLTNINAFVFNCSCFTIIVITIREE